MTPVDEDAERLARLALDEGRPGDALDVLMRAYGPALRNYCRCMLAVPADAWDVSQTTFEAAFTSFCRFKRRSSFLVWLFGIARHRCLDIGKRRRRADLGNRRISAELEPPTAPETVVPVEEMRLSLLEECLDQLPADLRMLVVIKHMEGYTYPQISRMLGGEQASTLQKRVTSVIARLEGCIEKKESSDEPAARARG